MDFIGTKEFRDFIEVQGKFRRKLAYLVLSGKDTDEVVEELKQKIKRYEFAKDRVVFDFENINTTVSELARSISLSVPNSTYEKVYQSLNNGSKRGYKMQNLPSDLVHLICEHQGCKSEQFILPYSESDKVKIK